MLVRNKSTDKDGYGWIVGGKRKRYRKIKEEGTFSFSFQKEGGSATLTPPPPFKGKKVDDKQFEKKEKERKEQGKGKQIRKKGRLEGGRL